jgi:hypothetical protein
MKPIQCFILLTISTVLLSSCVSRTVTSDAPLGKESSVVEKKIVWIWQDEFRNR